MKALILAAAMAAAVPGLAAPIAPTEAKNYVGKAATVEGVAFVHTTAGGIAFIDLGGKGRGALFTAVIFKEQAGNFPNVASCDDKTVE